MGSTTRHPKTWKGSKSEENGHSSPGRTHEVSCPRPGSSFGGDSGVPWLRRLGKRAFRAVVARVLRSGPIPRHVAFIMDGNRRYDPLASSRQAGPVDWPVPLFPAQWWTGDSHMHACSACMRGKNGESTTVRCDDAVYFTVQVGREAQPRQEGGAFFRLHPAQGMSKVVP